MTEREDCPLCQGTGIGQHGDPDTSRCGRCFGRGYLLDDEDDGDREYEEWVDRKWAERERKAKPEVEVE